MGLYKLCEHKGRARDRCGHAWWARFRHARVSLGKWSNREIKTKTEADIAFHDLKDAVRAGTFDKRGLQPPRDTSPMTFRQFAEVYKERHVFAKGLAIGWTIDYTGSNRSSTTSAIERLRKSRRPTSRISSRISGSLES